MVFPFFIPLRKKKTKVLGHPYNFFPQIFQFSLQTEKSLWAQPTWEFTVPLCIWISPKPKKMGSSFHQVIPTTIKLFKHTKMLTIGGVVAVCNGLNMTQETDKSSPGSKKHCHLQASGYTTLLSYKAIYKPWVPSCIFRVWLRHADTTYLQAIQDPGNPSYLFCKGFWRLGFLGWRDTNGETRSILPTSNSWASLTWPENNIPFFAECYDVCRDNTVLDSCFASSIKWKGLTRILVGTVIWFKHRRQ